MYLPYSITLSLFAIAGLAIAIWSGRRVLSAKKAEKWIKTEATIKYAAASENESNEIPRINYHYSVDDKNYQQQIITNDVAPMPGQTHPMLIKYPEDSTLDVFYNPEQPDKSTLSKAVKPEDWVVFGIGISTMFLGLYTLI